MVPGSLIIFASNFRGRLSFTSVVEPVELPGFAGRRPTGWAGKTILAAMERERKGAFERVEKMVEEEEKSLHNDGDKRSEFGLFSAHIACETK